MNELFSNLKPIAERIRPQTIAELENLSTLTPNQLALLKQDKIPSIVLYGSPGSGKTTIARCLRQKTKRYVEFQAVTTGVKEFREEMLKADFINPLMIFIDEIHRLNKAQQDLFLPFIESGAVVLVGATTESPYYHLNQALLSRVRVLKLDIWDREKLEKLVPLIEKEMEHKFDEGLIDQAIKYSGGDLRRFIYYFEHPQLEESSMISQNQRYNLISAFIKSMRDSDTDASMFYGLTLLERGEDPLYLLRRMIIFSSEDIGNINPQAMILANSVQEAFKTIGYPEGKILISQLIVYLAESEKSRYSYDKLRLTEQVILNNTNFSVPLHLRHGNKEKIKTDNLEEDIRKGFE